MKIFPIPCPKKELKLLCQPLNILPNQLILNMINIQFSTPLRCATRTTNPAMTVLQCIHNRSSVMFKNPKGKDSDQ